MSETVTDRRMIRVDLAVKFRIGCVTLGSLRRSWALKMPLPDLLLTETPSIHMNERGVRLDLWVE